MPSKSTFPCPGCGEDVPATAKACPHCGACGKSGWNEEASDCDGLDLPGEDFDYEKFTEEEFGRPRQRGGKELLFRIIGVILLIVMIVLILTNFLFWP